MSFFELFYGPDIGKLKKKRDVNKLIKIVKNKDKKLQTEALQALCEIGGNEVGEFLLDWAKPILYMWEMIPDQERPSQELLYELVRTIKKTGRRSTKTLGFFLNINQMGQLEKWNQNIINESAEAIQILEKLDENIIKKQKGEISLPTSVDMLIEELIQIGYQPISDGALPCTSFYPNIARERSKAIGQQLNILQGRVAMDNAIFKVEVKLGLGAASELNDVWNGIGNWIS